jgi:hypothetical protein
MTTYKPHGRYDFSCHITAMIYGKADQTITLFQDFECQLDVDCSLKGDDLDVRCTDVLVNGVSLANGDDTAKMIRLQVMEKADEQLEQGGWLFDQVREAEGLTLTGHPNDPDTSWRQQAAE